MNKPSEVKTNRVGDVAYETGDWAEAWAQPDGRVELRGKYFAMWRWARQKQAWVLIAAIYTPLQCLGESKYCK